MVISSLRLADISKKWHGGASKVTSPTAAAAGATAAACPRGHFAAYTRDGSRFFIPIAYLGSDVFRELLNTAEEEFGTPGGDRPIVLPCSAASLDQILAAFRGGAGKKCSSSGGRSSRSKLW